MSKYGKYTGGQIESVLNNIGGERVIDGLLARTMRVVVVPVVPKRAPSPTITCSVVSGNRCSIDGSFFDDGDDVCQHGHQVGQRYESPAA